MGTAARIPVIQQFVFCQDFIWKETIIFSHSRIKELYLVHLVTVLFLILTVLHFSISTLVTENYEQVMFYFMD